MAFNNTVLGNNLHNKRATQSCPSSDDMRNGTETRGPRAYGVNDFEDKSMLHALRGNIQHFLYIYYTSDVHVCFRF